jgi:hypothetical protein
MGTLYLTEQTAPDTPPTGQVVMYPKTDGYMYSKDDAGTETQLNTPGAASEGASGVVELATQAEVNAMTDTSRVLTPNHTRIVLGTEQASTSGTSIDFTGIPSGVSRIVVQFVGVSTNGTSDWLIQIGDSGGVETTGYLSAKSTLSTAVTTENYTSGFGLCDSAASSVLHGAITMTLESSSANTWVATGALTYSNAAQMCVSAGSMQAQ